MVAFHKPAGTIGSNRQQRRINLRKVSNFFYDMELRKYSLLLRFALFLNPLIHLIEPFVSRSREYLADETAAWITRAPKNLASALLKIEEYTVSYKDRKFLTTIPPEVFFFECSTCTPYIFSRSPSTEKRVRRLILINSQMAYRRSFSL